jgi:hypothetical protein
MGRECRVLRAAENAALRMRALFSVTVVGFDGGCSKCHEEKIRREVMKKKLKVKIIRNGKKRGEWAELVFAARATEQGLPLSKP